MRHESRVSDRDRFARVIDFGLVDEAVGDHNHVLSPRGEIDAHTAPKLGSRLFGLAEDGARGVVVDLSHVTFMDSTGIGVLLNALRHLNIRRCKMVLVCPTERIMRPFEITGLTGHLTIFDSREKALGCLA
jgi:anti-sigma B factor antagonist